MKIAILAAAVLGLSATSAAAYYEPTAKAVAQSCIVGSSACEVYLISVFQSVWEDDNSPESLREGRETQKLIPTATPFLCSGVTPPVATLKRWFMKTYREEGRSPDGYDVAAASIYSNAKRCRR